MKQTIPTYRLSLLLLLALMTGRMSFAQSQAGPLTLQQCIQYGLTNNAGVLKSRLETDRTVEKKAETRAGYLPQVNGTVSLIDNLKLQTSILPGEIIGQPGTMVAVQFGTKYNVTAGIDATQVIYDQGLIYSMKITEQSTKISEINAKKTEEQLIYDIASAYYAAQVSLTQKTIVQSNLTQVDTLLKVTGIQFENGFAKQLDLDRLMVNQTNLQTDLATSEMNYQQQLMLLKYYMGMPLETPVELPVITGNEQGGSLINTETLNRTDLDLIQAQKDLYALNLKQLKAGYLPSLTMNFRTALQIQQNDLRIFASDADWFPNAYVGVNLNIPIFDGLARNSRVNQMKIQIRQTELDEQYLNESLKMQRTNATNKLNTNKLSLESQQRNIDLARKVYETTQAQYVGGIATMTDLVNAETSMKEAQTNYLRALVQVKLAELDLIKTTGNITSLN
jgi:outer membrane protein